MAEKCKTCGDVVQIYHMCDIDEGPWCSGCFLDTPCGKGEHGEGCPTNVWDDNPELPK